jgi:hypothetical protein
MGAWWDEEHTLWLVTPEEFARLPDGFELTCIDGDTAIKGKDKIDDDTRFGHIAYGASKEAILTALEGSDGPTG